MSGESPTYGGSVGAKMRRASQYFGLYERTASEIQMDVINKLVPKSARVEYQRLHWKDKNDGKLMISFCPARGFDFGPLPKEKRKIGKKTRKVCTVPGCETVLVKKTWAGWQT